MPEISVQHQPASLNDLVPCESFGEPVGPLPKQTDGAFYESGKMITGTWECEPGTLQLETSPPGTPIRLGERIGRLG